jgi:hypothetical protein
MDGACGTDKVRGVPQHASNTRSWEVEAFIVSPLRSAFRRARIWPGEITSGTYHGRLPPVTPEHLAASGG